MVQNGNFLPFKIRSYLSNWLAWWVLAEALCAPYKKDYSSCQPFFRGFVGTIAVRIQHQILRTKLRASRSTPHNYSVTHQRHNFGNNVLSHHHDFSDVTLMASIKMLACIAETYRNIMSILKVGWTLGQHWKFLTFIIITQEYKTFNSPGAS